MFKTPAIQLKKSLTAKTRTYLIYLQLALHSCNVPKIKIREDNCVYCRKYVKKKNKIKNWILLKGLFFRFSKKQQFGYTVRSISWSLTFITRRISKSYSTYKIFVTAGNTHFLISNSAVRKARLKLAKNQAKAEQRPEAELLLFENYSLSSSKKIF